MDIHQILLYYCEDNTSCHRSRFIEAEHLDNGFTKILLPPCSPDMNSIEQIWLHIKRKIKEKISWNFTNLAIRKILVDKWLNIPVDLVNDLIGSMPRRLAAIIAANGGNEFEG